MTGMAFAVTKMFRLLPVVLAVWLAAGMGLPSAANAQTSTDVRSATAAVTEWSRTWEQGDLFAVYDEMHPEGRNRFPRQAFLAWAASDEVGTPVDDPEVVDITIEVEWVSPDTEETYRRVAMVKYRQEVELGGQTTTIDADAIFVREGLDWRWLPTTDEEVVARFSDEANTAAEAYESDFRRAAYARIDRFWNGAFAAVGTTYEPPTAIVAVDTQPMETGCGVETEIEKVGIYYCVLDQSVYYDPGFREMVVDASGSYGFTMILAHEWGHHIQWLQGVTVSNNPESDGGLYPIDLELQADCLGGIYTQDALANGLIDMDDVDAAITIAMSSGDRPSTEWDDRDAHGTGSQRVQSFMTGFEDGFAGCNLELEPVG